MEPCIICGETFPTGLRVMGCFICFPCEKRLLWSAVPDQNRRRLGRIYGEPLLLHARQQI